MTNFMTVTVISKTGQQMTSILTRNTCTHMHACMYAYMHTRVHAYTHTRVHTCMHACMHTCTHAYTRTRIHAYTHACVHSYMHAHAYTRTRRHSCMSCSTLDQTDIYTLFSETVITVCLSNNCSINHKLALWMLCKNNATVPEQMSTNRNC